MVVFILGSPVEITENLWAKIGESKTMVVRVEQPSNTSHGILLPGTPSFHKLGPKSNDGATATFRYGVTAVDVVIQGFQRVTL